MASLPRIITVDPTGSIPQQIRAAFDLMDRVVIQIDVPDSSQALVELERGGIDTIIAAWNLEDGKQGWELAAQLRKVDEDVKIILLGDYNDTELDDEMREQSPFVYLKRPFNIPQLIKVLQAAIADGDIFAALNARTDPAPSTTVNLGPVPNVNADKADEVMQGVIYDLNPLAAMLATRDGEIVVGRTTMGDVDYDYMASLIGSTAKMNIDMRDVIGGNLQTLQLYDGSDYDVFVLSVGLHHFLTIVFDGKDGANQIGAVRRFGSKRAEDLIAIIGPAAFFVQPSVREPEPESIARKSDQNKKLVTQETTIPELARANLGTSETEVVSKETNPVIESAIPQLEAIADDAFDADLLFGDDFDLGDEDDLFSLEALEDLDFDDNKKGTTDWDGAMQLGIIDDN